ncbi:MAG: hypothetical protein E6J84_14865 [Deltaproteobacteria bacterium]|nr:MAG: hypothetical protein E6J84_14865 [Deltaproteobacteria bacterium]
MDRRPALHHPIGAVRGDGRCPRRPRIAAASPRLARPRRIRRGGDRAALVVTAQWAAPPGDDRGAVRFLAEQWEPDPPPGARRFTPR